MTIEKVIFICLAISVLSVIGGLMMFFLKMGDDSVFTPMIVVVFLGQLGTPIGYAIIWYVKFFEGWKVPMIPLIMGSIAGGILFGILLFDNIWLLFAKPNNQISGGSVHPISGDSELVVVPTVMIYTICNIIILGPILWHMIFE